MFLFLSKFKASLFVLFITFSLSILNGVYLKDELDFNDFDELYLVLDDGDFNKELMEKVLQTALFLYHSQLTEKANFPEEELDSEDFFYAQKSNSQGLNKIFVIGDLHGDLVSLAYIIFDLIDKEYLTKELILSEGVNLIGLGDYIDRGEQSIEVLALLLILKIQNPKQVILLKGNHELESSVRAFGFIREIEGFYNAFCDLESLDLRGVYEKIDKMFESFINLFNYFPTVYYQKFNDKYFMFNHAGYYVNDSIIEFLDSNKKYKLIFSYAATHFLWSDLGCDLIGFKESFRGAGFEQPAGLVIPSMQHFLAKIGGHRHSVPKLLDYGKHRSLLNVDDTPGFINVGTVETPIYILISGTIVYPNADLDLNFFPSYLMLDLDYQASVWAVKGLYLDDSEKDDSEKPFKALDVGLLKSKITLSEPGSLEMLFDEHDPARLLKYVVYSDSSEEDWEDDYSD